MMLDLRRLRMAWEVPLGRLIYLFSAMHVIYGALTPFQYITTIAGTFSVNGGYSGENVQATSAQFKGPSFLAIDGSGGVYISDETNNVVRYVASNGIITPFGGKGGYQGHSGDGEYATSALLNYPRGLALDSTDLYISDSGNHCIRRVKLSTNIISLFAGTIQSASPSPIGSNGDGGQATSATLNSPSGLALDSSGNLFIADKFNNRVRRVATDGIITTYAGTGAGTCSGSNGQRTSAAMYSPYGLYVSADSSLLYVTEQASHVLRKISAFSGIITLVAGIPNSGAVGNDNIAATSSRLYSPSGVSVDSSGNIYIADTNSNKLRQIDASTGIISTLAGDGSTGYNGDDGSGTSISVYYPVSIIADTSGLFFTDFGNNLVRKMIASPTATPTVTPTVVPTKTPTTTPTLSPSAVPSRRPTAAPSVIPTRNPTRAPTAVPTMTPSATPTTTPTRSPTVAPTKVPTTSPTAAPTASPSAVPSSSPTFAPSAAPTAPPSMAPTAVPSTGAPVPPPSYPTFTPSTAVPTTTPTAGPTAGPTATPTAVPTTTPTAGPTAGPTATPTAVPTTAPTAGPTAGPTATPTAVPTAGPTPIPSCKPSSKPTGLPSSQPSSKPSSSQPTRYPSSSEPSLRPSSQPSQQPTSNPSHTLLANRAYFSVLQRLDHITQKGFNSSSFAKLTMRQAVAGTMPYVVPADIEITNVYDYDYSTTPEFLRPNYKSVALAYNVYFVDERLSVSKNWASQYEFLIYNLKQSLVPEIDNNMTFIIQYFARQLSCSVLYNVSSYELLSLSDAIEVNFVSSRPTGAETVSPQSAASKAIALIKVFGGILAFVFAAGAFFAIYRYYSSRERKAGRAYDRWLETFEGQRVVSTGRPRLGMEAAMKVQVANPLGGPKKLQKTVVASLEGLGSGAAEEVADSLQESAKRDSSFSYPFAQGEEGGLQFTANPMQKANR